MAPSRRPESEAPQHESSSEEEEEEEEDSSGSSSEEEQPQNATTTSAPKKPLSIPTSSAPTKPQPTSNPSESETNSEYESDSNSPPITTAAITYRPDPNIKPTSSKLMQDPKPTKKPRSNPTPSTPPPKSAASAAKRPAAEIQSNGGPGDSKAKRKKEEKDVAAVINNTGNSGIETKPGKQNMFQRLWSEDDEIEILKGLLDFRAKKGFDPMTDLNAFHDFVGKSLRCGDVSSSQFSTKVRRIKKKFENNAKKKGKDGLERSFKNPHEQRLYDLSKKIWGEDSEGFGAESAKKRRKTEKGLYEELEEGANAGAIGLGSNVEEVVMKEGLELIGGSKKVKIMEKWRQYRVEEVELYVKKLGLVTEQAKLVLEALRKGRF